MTVRYRHILVALLLLLGLLLVVPTRSAWANQVLTVQTDAIGTPAKGSSDWPTDIKVAKLSSDTQEYVKGAHLAIINKKTGATVKDWYTDGDLDSFPKLLDVNTTYILRELSAPKGYEVAKDIEFTINEKDGELTIKSSNTDGHAEVYDKTILRLYDRPAGSVQNVNVTKKGEDTVEREKSKGTEQGNEQGTQKPGETMAQTSDDTNRLPAVILATVGCVLLALGLMTQRRRRFR